MNKPEIRQYTREDINAVHSIALASAEADQVDPKSTLEYIPTFEELAESLGDGSSHDVLVAVDDTGNIVGYGQVKWWQEEDGTLIYVHSGSVDPSARRRGIGSQLVTSLQERIKELAATHFEV